MPTQSDVFDRPQPLSGSLVHSLLLHGSLGAIILAGQLGLFGPSVNSMGDPNPTFGGSVGISPVRTISLPTPTGRPNPVANDTKSQVPQAPKPAPREQTKAPPPDETAIPLKGQQQKPKENTARRRNPAETPDNQVYSSSGDRIVSPLYGGQGGDGGGVGVTTPFGNRFGYYAQQVRDILQRNWRTDRIPPAIRSAPLVKASFYIHRDGSISDIRIDAPSGVSPVDISVLRAIQDAGRFPPLPAGFERSSAKVEISFEFRR
jgi:protein TonB